MIYAVTIETAKETPKTALSKTILRVNKGLVYHVEVYFPPGSAGLMGVLICDGAYQAWPTTPGEFFVGDNTLIQYADTYLKQTEPFQFEVYTYNSDDTYAHSVHVRLGLVSERIFMARFLPHISYEFYTEMIQEIQAAQEEERQAQLTSPFPWAAG